MSAENLAKVENGNRDTNGALTAGVILIVIGAGILASRVFSLESWFPLGLGLIFAFAGIMRRKAGLLIPAGILSGVGLGVLLTQNGPLAALSEMNTGAVILLSMALGWFSIPVTTRLFTDETHVWPVFPGGAMAVIGGLMLAGADGMKVLEALNNYWPLILVVIGAWILFRAVLRKQ